MRMDRTSEFTNTETSVLALIDREITRMTQESDRSLWLEVNFRSLSLCKLVQGALSGRVVGCFEDGDLDDEVTLKEAFRIKTNN